MYDAPFGHKHCMPPGLGLGRGILREVFSNLKDFWPSSFVPYDLDETAEEYILTLPMPGFDAKEIEVSVKGNAILVEGNKSEEDKKEEPSGTSEKKRLVSMGNFLWNHPRVEVPLDDEIDPDNISAKLDRGILTVRLTKTPRAKIPVEN
ncbi:MAG TPA: Hsp20/alpha crystallin family protein [Candidatus Lokiarchaeia archaeon]|nr:Hsp20/alpha crystallin family protein [Candidatus Lokiarchaeia archaeon]